MKKNIEYEYMGDRLISKADAAGILGVSMRTLERIISAGRLNVRRIGGCVRLLLSEILFLAGIEFPHQP